MKRKVLITIFALSSFLNFGQTWDSVGTGLSNYACDLQKFHNKLYVGGHCGVEFWNDTSWTSLPNPFDMYFPVNLSVYNDTLYIAAGQWGGYGASIYKFDGANWIEVASIYSTSNPSSSIFQLLPFNGQLISGGSFNSVIKVNVMPPYNVASINNVAVWDGTTWDSLGHGLNGEVSNLAEYNGQLFASGYFTASGNDTTVKYIARWNGIKWSPLDTTYSFINNTGGGRPMIVFDSLLIIGNVWDTISGMEMKGITAWNGTTFISISNDWIRTINNFWVFNNELYMGGVIYTMSPSDPYDHACVVLKWDGSNWLQVGGAFNQGVETIDDYNNQLYCGGFYTSPTSYVARIDNMVGISTNEEQESCIKIYPNPANSIIKVSTNEQIIQIKIIDILGNQLLNTKQKEIDISYLTDGIYFLQTENSTQKFIVQH